MRTTTCLACAALTLALAAGIRADEKSGRDDEGFLQKWLVLAPIPLDANDDGAAGLAKAQLKDEAKLKPKAGDKVKAGGKDLAWKAHAIKDHSLDFNALLGSQVEDSVAYAVTYVVADSDAKAVTMKTGSDDQLKVWLNGKEVVKHTEDRSAEKDQDSTEVALKKGVNVLVVKVVNVKVDWSVCVRFTDKDGKPVKGLTAKTAE